MPHCLRLQFCWRDHAAWHPQRQGTRFVALLCVFPLSGMEMLLAQQPLPRHMIELEPDTVRVLEQNRIIARRPLILARGADDVGVERAEETVQFVDVVAFAGPDGGMWTPAAFV